MMYKLDKCEYVAIMMGSFIISILLYVLIGFITLKPSIHMVLIETIILLLLVTSCNFVASHVFIDINKVYVRYMMILPLINLAIAFIALILSTVFNSILVCISFYVIISILRIIGIDMMTIKTCRQNKFRQYDEEDNQ